MQHLTTTVIAVVGTEAAAALGTAGRARNVRVLPGCGDPVAAWREVVRTRRTFTLIADDPLDAVAAAWTQLFASQQRTGALDVAVMETAQRIRAGALDLPDFYVVAGQADFHLTVLQPAAPHRVVPAGADPLRTVSGLGAGRWWPPPAELLADLDRRLPDRFTTPGQAGGATLVDVRGS